MAELKPKTAASTKPNAVTAEERNEWLEFELPSGKKCKISRFKGKHVQQAKRLMSDDGSDLAECLGAILCTIDGARIQKEDFAEMDGMDYFKILKPINELFL